MRAPVTPRLVPGTLPHDTKLLRARGLLVVVLSWTLFAVTVHVTQDLNGFMTRFLCPIEYTVHQLATVVGAV